MKVNFHTHTVSESQFPAIINLKDPDSFEFLQSCNECFFSTGIHPWDINEDYPTEFRKVERCFENNRFVAVGECGFDKKIDVPFEIQKKIFIEHIQLSEKKCRPLIIHCVGFYNELISLKRISRPAQPWIIHGFRGKQQLAQQLINEGFYLSFGEKFNTESVRITPLNRLVIETDESSLLISELYEKIALIKKCLVSDLCTGYDLLKKIIEIQ